METDARPREWTKLWRQTLRDRRLRRGPVDARWLWVIVQTLPDAFDGRLVTDGVTLTADDLADEAGLSPEDTESALEYLLGVGLLTRDAGVGAYVIPDYRRSQESPSAARMRRFRARQNEEEDHRGERREERGESDALRDITSGVTVTPSRTTHDTEPAPHPPDGLVEIPVRQPAKGSSPSTWWLTREVARTIARPLGVAVADVERVAEDLASQVRAGAKDAYTYQGCRQGLAKWVATESKWIKRRRGRFTGPAAEPGPSNDDLLQVFEGAR